MYQITLLCRNCKWFEGNEVNYSQEHNSRCMRPDAVEPVMGKHYYAGYEREGGKCGENGLFWEEFIPDKVLVDDKGLPDNELVVFGMETSKWTGI